jgi:DNA polymerase-3 subunit epsilon
MTSLPSKPGVLYFLDDNGQVLYLIKSKNIRKKAWSIITRFNNRRYSAIATLSTKIDYVVTGSQLLASIREGEELRTLNPKYNRKFNTHESRYSIYENLNEQGFLLLETDVYDKVKQPVVTFSSAKEANAVLNEMISEFQLLSASEMKQPASVMFANNCEEYNGRVSEAVKSLHGRRKNFLVTDHGPEPNQLSIVVIQNGIYSGYLYTDRQQQFQDVEDVLERMHRSEDHPSSIKSIIRHVSQGHYRDIIHF